MNKLQAQEEYWDNVAEEKEFTTPLTAFINNTNTPEKAYATIGLKAA